MLYEVGQQYFDSMYAYNFIYVTLENISQHYYSEIRSRLITINKRFVAYMNNTHPLAMSLIVSPGTIRGHWWFGAIV